MLYGGCLTVYTNHQNLTFKTLSIQCILRCCLFMDEFNLTLEYIKGKDNVLADFFLGLPIMRKPAEEDGLLKIQLKHKKKGQEIIFNAINIDRSTMIDDEEFYIEYDKCKEYFQTNDVDVMDLFLNLPELTFDKSPLSMKNIHRHQEADLKLIHLFQQDL